MPTNINKLNHISLKAICLKDARLCELVQKNLALVNYRKEKTLVYITDQMKIRMFCKFSKEY